MEKIVNLEVFLSLANNHVRGSIMRRLISLMLSIMFILTGCNDYTKMPALSLDDQEFDGYQFEQSLYYDYDARIKFRVSPMVEATYLAVEMLYDKTGFTNYPDNTVFVEDSIEVFKDYKDHSFIKMLSPMIKKGYSYDAIPSSLYYFDEYFRLRNDIELDISILKRAGGKENLEDLLVHLKTFRMDSDFDSYFRENKELYLNMLKMGQDMVTTYKVDDIIEEFYGKPIENATVTVTPFAQNAYGCSLIRKDGVLEMHPTLSVYENKEAFLSTLVHEFSHTYVNPLTTKHLELVDNTKVLYEPIKKIMSNQAYSNWETTINEHIVRANTAVMIRSILGQTAYENELNRNRERGFKYIDDVVESILYYKENRDVYSTLEDYYPEIMKVFESLAGIN